MIFSHEYYFKSNKCKVENISFYTKFWTFYKTKHFNIVRYFKYFAVKQCYIIFYEMSFNKKRKKTFFMIFKT